MGQASPSSRLRSFRARHGISQAKAAKLCNTPVRTWQGWESEHREPPPCLLLLLDYIDVHGPLNASANAATDREGGEDACH